MRARITDELESPSMKLPDQEKTREITFSALPENQAQLALLLLDGMPDMRVELAVRPDTIVVHYDVRGYSLEKLEAALLSQGFHLDNGLLYKLRRALVYFCERNQRDNLSVPLAQQKSAKPFVEAFNHHPHGDRDDTPEELRGYQ
jgi:hypothetical protein